MHELYVCARGDQRRGLLRRAVVHQAIHVALHRIVEVLGEQPGQRDVAVHQEVVDLLRRERGVRVLHHAATHAHTL